MESPFLFAHKKKLFLTFNNTELAFDFLKASFVF